MPDLSVIIVSYKGWDHLTLCLESLDEFSQEAYSSEVIVVDNRSDDEEIGKIESRFSKFSFIYNKVNGGFANGCNLGAINAAGEYLLFLNPDTVASESEIGKLLAVAKQNPEFTALSCRQVNEKGKECVSTGSFPRFSNLTGFMRAIFKNSKKAGTALMAGLSDQFIFPDWISGSVVLIKRDVFRETGGFDEDFWMYYEDVDLCKRITDNGGTVVSCRNITIRHDHGGSSRINAGTAALTKTEVNISRHVYISKHKKGRDRIMIQGFLVLNNLISGLVMALLGLLQFFIPRLFVRTLMYIRLLSYYMGSVFRRSWISPMSVHYLK